MTKKTVPELKVIFDTSSLYSVSASDLLSNKVLTLIKDNSKFSDLILSWYLPKIVIFERQRQMISRGLAMLETIQKLEKLLGHNLNITEDIITSRVSEIINRQLRENSIQVIPLDSKIVNWDEIITNACFRKPPFKKSPKEEGFRDSLIAETFFQIVANSPSTTKKCRLSMITEDAPLFEYLKEKTKDFPNVRILSNIEDLQSLINTLVSEVTEELIDKLQPQASKYFFEPDNKDTLFYKWDIRRKITTQYDSKLSENHPNCNYRENGDWYVSQPRFKKKVRQRIFWTTHIAVESKAYEYIKESPVAIFDSTAHDTYSSKIPSSLFNLALSPTSYVGHYRGAPALTKSLLTDPMEKKLIANGRTEFEVFWSHLLSTNQKFRNPKIKKIDFIEINWDVPASN